MGSNSLRRRLKILGVRRAETDQAESRERPQAQSPWTHRAITALILGATFIILMTLAISTARNVARGDALAVVTAEEAVARAADVAQSVLDSHLRQVDGQLVGLSAWLRQGLVSRQEPARSSEALLELAARSHTHRNLMLADAQGVIWASADPTRIGGSLPLSREALALAERAPGCSLHGPMPSLNDGVTVLLMLRRVGSDEIGQAVFAAAEIPTAMITNVLAPMANPPQLRVRMETLEGLILAAGPGQVRLIGQTLLPALAELRPDLQVSLHEDRQSRGQPTAGLVFAAARPLVVPGLVAVVALPEAVALGGWPLLRLSILTGLGIAALLLVALAAAVFFAAWIRHRAVIEGEAANLRLIAAVESLPDGFVLWDAEDRLVIWNSRYAELYGNLRETLRPGLKFEEVTRGWIVSGIFKPSGGDLPRRLAQALASLRNPGPATEHEMQDGRWLRVARSRMPSGGTVVILTDITALKHAMAELGEARDAADHATTAKSNLLAHVSYELRTPLAGLLRLADALKREASLPSAQRHQAGLVGATAQHLLALANEVLDLAAMEAQSLKLQPGIASPQEICNEAISMVQPLAEARQVGLVFTHADLPAHIEVDATRLRQMLLNLLTNAVKYTPTGTQVRLSATVQGTPERLRCEVSDQGSGVPEAQRDHLFQDFTRLASGLPLEGTGLGLSITARLASLMGGRIGYTDATPAPGACFWVELPLRRVTARDVPPSSGSVLAQRHLRLLAVDDAPSNLAVLRAMLSNTGFDLETVNEGRAALEAVEIAAREDRPFDAILMDVMMPGMDGLETTRRIRAMPGSMGRMPIIAVTASAFPEDIAKTREAGMQDHVIKPVERALLLNTLASCVKPAPSDTAAPDAADALRPMFLAELWLRLAQLEQALQSGGNPVEPVHALAGTVGHLGQPERVDQARRVLAALREGQPEAAAMATSLLAELRAAFPEAV